MRPLGFRSDGGSRAASVLPGDNLALDLGVDACRNDLLLHQLVLTLVRPVLDDVGGALVADPWQGLNIGRARRINVEQLGGAAAFAGADAAGAAAAAGGALAGAAVCAILRRPRHQCRRWPKTI